MSKHRAASYAILLAALAASSLVVQAQSSKTSQQQISNQRQFNSSPASYSSSSPAPSPVAQMRQQQQQQQQQQINYNTQASTPRKPAATKSRPIAAQRPIDQQQQNEDDYSDNNNSGNSQTVDPLADSEPAVYGSVAGKPGIDFPAYTQIPKTSFTCEGKSYDFGFYADEEAQCQLFHVCFGGRRESFLCGVGTVFNQAILACDYWHSVDCSKSSQFYDSNSELGKTSAKPNFEPQRPNQNQNRFNQPQSVRPNSDDQQQQIQSPVNQRRPTPVAPARQQPTTTTQQQVQEDIDLGELPQQQRLEPSRESSGYESPSSGFSTPARARQLQPATPPSDGYNQKPVMIGSGSTKSNLALNQQQVIQSPSVADNREPSYKGAPAPATSANTKRRWGQKRTQQANRLNKNINIIIDSPVRPPIEDAPTKQRQQPSSNFAQMAVSRAQQSGSRTLNSAKSTYSKPSTQQPIRQQPVTQQRNTDVDTEEPPVVQQTQQPVGAGFDDAPVQTSTASNTFSRPTTSQPIQTTSAGYGNSNNNNQNNFQNNNNLQQTITIPTGPDGSSAITNQFDTIQAPGSSDSPTFESNVEDSNYANDDFKSAGAKAAASQNRNWYIMRSI